VPFLKMLSIAKTTLHVASVVGEWNISMEHRWNETDREHKSNWIKTCPTATLYTTNPTVAVIKPKPPL
jgi:hypothetical protein